MRSIIRFVTRGQAMRRRCSHGAMTACRSCFSTSPEPIGKTCKKFLFQGVQLVTHYSGKGTAESIVKQLEEVLREDLRTSGQLASRRLHGLADAQFRCVSACDQLPVCQEMLVEVGAEHVFGALESRVKPQIYTQLKPLMPTNDGFKSLSKEKLEEKNLAFRDELFRKRAKAYTSGNTCWCFRHGAQCPIWGDIDLGAKATAASEPGVISVAGFSCVDFSPREGSAALRLAGKTAPSFWSWLAEVLVLEPTLVFYENGPNFNGEVFEQVPEIWQMYAHQDVLVSPSHLGWPVSRLRRFGVLVHRYKAIFNGSGNEFLHVFRRSCSLSGDIFWSLSPEEYVIAELLKKARKRGHHFRGAQTLEELKGRENLKYMVTPTTMDRMVAYEKLRPMKEGLNGNYIVDLDQSRDSQCHGPQGCIASTSFLLWFMGPI